MIESVLALGIDTSGVDTLALGGVIFKGGIILFCLVAISKWLGWW